MANTYTSLTYHLVFSTKYRRTLIRDEVASDLYRYIAGIIQANKSQPIEINGVDDHVHILTGITSTIAISDMLRLIKTNSSKWFNDNHARNVKFGWQTGYAAFTVSQSRIHTVRAYIQNQRQHHRKITFREEYLAMLQRHNIEFDARYVFDEEHVA